MIWTRIVFRKKLKIYLCVTFDPCKLAILTGPTVPIKLTPELFYPFHSCFVQHESKDKTKLPLQGKSLEYNN